MTSGLALTSDPNRHDRMYACRRKPRNSLTGSQYSIGIAALNGATLVAVGHFDADASVGRTDAATFDSVRSQKDHHVPVVSIGAIVKRQNTQRENQPIK